MIRSRGPRWALLVGALSLLVTATGATVAPVPPPESGTDVLVPVVEPRRWAEIDPTPTPRRGVHQMGPCPARVPGDGVLLGSDVAPNPWGELEESPGPARDGGALVAVIDTGVALHPRLAGRIVDGGDHVAAAAPRDCDGHGTAVAGLIAASASPADAFAGVDPAARVVAFRQSSQYFGFGATRGAGDLGTMASAVRHAVETPGVDVINVSLAACVDRPTLRTPPALRLQAAVHEAARRGILVVVAAGNAGPSCPQNDDAARPRTVVLPAAYAPDVLAVGSAESDGMPSVRGPWTRVRAPGSVGTSLDATGSGLTDRLATPGATESARLAGSSVAAALVSGLVALLRSEHPGISPAEVTSRLLAASGPAGVDPARVLGRPAGTAPGPALSPVPVAPEPEAAPVVVALAVLAATSVLGLAARRARRERRRE